uniref:BTB/POZ domain-containing protein 9 n=1 Tax=Cacopsylla melanoneura TaxID=428564 RepID=A0A8D9E2S1_9HEMI
MISTHYEHCHDKEIKLHNVKNKESFSVILQYMYGMRINFSEINVSVLCEVLNLSETYKLDAFFKDLKHYLSNINTFQLESCIVLLNTADKYNVPELCEQLIIFVYENVEQLMKHDSFKTLQYNILVDLLKRDWFCCSEIEILTGVLNWHSDMDDESKKQMSLKKVLVCQDDTEDQHGSTDVLEVSECEIDVADINEVETNTVENECSMIEQKDLNMGDACTNSIIKDSSAKKDPNQNKTVVDVSDSEIDDTERKDIQSNVESQCSKTEDLVVIGGDTISNSKDSFNAANSESAVAKDVVVNGGDTISNSKDNINAANSKKADGCANIMQTFSENILKSLLAQIRISRISALEFSEAMETELFKKYSWIIRDVKSFSRSCEPRQTYYKIKEINDVTKRFTIKGELRENIVYESEEVYSVGDFKWKLCMKWNQDKEDSDYQHFSMFIKVDSEHNVWECTVECQVRWKSNSTSYENKVLPEQYVFCAPKPEYLALDFRSDHCKKTINYIYLDEWEIDRYCDTGDFDNAFEPDHIRTFELVFKSLKYK